MPSRAGQPSAHTGPLSPGSWRGRGDRYHSQPFLTRTVDGLSWLGGPDVGVTAIGSSQSGTTIIGGGQSLSYLGSNDSPVDLRSAGRGALGLVSPPSDRSRREGEGGEEDEEYSPPQPRAFWREDWHGGGSDGCGSRVSRGSCSSGNRVSRSPRREETADLFGVDGEARISRGRHRMGEPKRFAAPATTVTAATATAALRRLGEVSAEESVGDERCRARIASRDSVGGRGRREDGASRSSSEWAKSRQGRTKNGGTGFDKASFIGNGSGGSSSNGTLSSGGFALLASVAIAAFAVGALLAPRPPRERSTFPSAAPLEYARRQPSSGYNPTMVERRENRGKSQRAKLGVLETVGAAGAPQTSTAAAEGSGERSDLQDDSVASPASGKVVSSPIGAAMGGVGGKFDRLQHGKLNSLAAGGREGMIAPLGTAPDPVERSCEPCVVAETSGDATTAVDNSAASSTTCCPNPAATEVGQRLTADATLSPLASARDESAPARAVTASLADADKPRRGKAYPGGGAFESTTRATILAWDRDLVDPRWRRWRRVRPRATQRLVVGAGPDAFSKTLGSAENSLVVLSDGQDRQAREDAWRVAASQSAAATACKAMASSSVTSAAPGGRRENELCDTGAAASRGREGKRGGGGRGIPRLFPFFSAQGGTPTIFNQDTTAAAAAAAASSMAAEPAAVPSTVTQKRGRLSENASRVLGVQETARGTRPPLDSGGGAQLGSTTSPAAQRRTSHNPRLSATVDGEGRSSTSPPRCSGLVLSGNDVQASWAGRYTLAPAREGLVDPRTIPSSTLPIETPFYFRDGAFPSSPGAEEEWEGVEGQDTHDTADFSVTLDRTDSVSPSRIQSGASVILDQTDSVIAELTGAVDGTDSIIPELTDSIDGTDSVIPEWTDSVTPGRTDSVSAGGEASADVSTAPGMPSGQRPDNAATSLRPPPQILGDQQELVEPGAAGDMLYLYWADASGGRWVLDDDLSLSNGVLGVTKDAAPVSPYLAFPNHHHHRHQSHQHRHIHQHHSGTEGSGGSDSIRLMPRVDGAGHGEGRGDAALSPQLSFAPSAWLIDSPRLQGWAEAEDVVVVCETD